MRQRRNIFVFGLDDFHREDLESLPRADEFEFHPLLTLDEATRADLYPVDEMLEKAERTLREFDGTVDAIVTHRHFPSSVMTPILRDRFSQPGPAVDAVLKCEHKFWSRLEQRRVAPDVVPDFAAVDPFAEDPLAGVDIDFPFWLKPVTAHSSNLGFRIDDGEQLQYALERIRKRIHLFGKPLNYLAGFAELPAQIAAVDGYHCITEEIISKGRQCTLEGYRYHGEFEIYGVVDTIRDRRYRSCLSRYQYPSSVPKRVQSRMTDVATGILDAFGYDDAAFNVEFYWDPGSDSLSLLEINGRISQSHCPMFALVDGASHQQAVIDLALGEQPRPPRREGPFNVAAKCMMRVFDEGVVVHAPTAGDATLLRQHFPEARFHCHVRDGMALADLPFQDSYSFNIADIYLGGDSQAQLLDKYDEARQVVPFEILRSPEVV